IKSSCARSKSPIAVRLYTKLPRRTDSPIPPRHRSRNKKHPERGAGREKRGSDSGRTRHERRAGFRASCVLRAMSLALGSRLDFHDLVQRMGVPSKDRTRFRHFLKELVREGLLHPAKGRGFRLDRESAEPGTGAGGG